MSSWRQIWPVTEMGLRSVPARLGTSLVVVTGVAAVVAVLVSALAIATSFTRAARSAGSHERAIVLTADTEAASGLSRDNAVAILNAPGIRAASDGVPIASAEALFFVTLADRSTGLNAFVAVRGVGPQAFALRPELEVVEGRTFASGAAELIVGRAAQRRLGGLDVGSSVALPTGDWTIVGAFESGGDSHESELVTDVETLLNAYRRNAYNAVTVSLDGAQTFERFAAALAADPTLTVSALREDAYFAAASGFVATLLTVVAYGIGGIMAFGAVFGALNTMYSAVGTRAREIATLRAIGFGPAPVIASVLAEALVLALAGAGIGAAVAFMLLDGSTISTMTGVTPSQLTFGLEVRPGLMLIGAACAVAIAAVGGLAAAARAARVPVAVAMRIER